MAKHSLSIESKLRIEIPKQETARYRTMQGVPKSPGSRLSNDKTFKENSTVRTRDEW